MTGDEIRLNDTKIRIGAVLCTVQKVKINWLGEKSITY